MKREQDGESQVLQVDTVGDIAVSYNTRVVILIGRHLPRQSLANLNGGHIYMTETGAVRDLGSTCFPNNWEPVAWAASS